MPTRVTIEDVESGDRAEQLLADGDYVVVTTEPCHVTSRQHYPLKGTCVITIKGHGPKPLPSDAVEGGV